MDNFMPNLWREVIYRTVVAVCLQDADVNVELGALALFYLGLMANPDTVVF
jgi:hypothetical protein